MTTRVVKLYKKKIITRGDDSAYLVRYSIFDCGLFAIKIHHILRSDDTCLHDHPWAFISFILWGGYVEETPTIKDRATYHNGSYYLDSAQGQHKKTLYGAGSILYRPAHWSHRLIVFQPAWTLVITFRKVKEWGFFTPRGWVPHFMHTKRNVCE